MSAELILLPTAQRERRALQHRALGDERRLAVVEALALSDRTPGELQRMTGLASNLLAHHLDVLEDAGVVVRQRSQGDGRRRYVTLAPEVPEALLPPVEVRAGRVLFVCTRNAARSQLAAALWTARTARPALSAGSHPAPEVHPLAVEVARAHGLDLTGARPRSYDDTGAAPDLVVSLCDRAREGEPPFDATLLHWSVPDPAGRDRAAFETAYEIIAGRVERLARRTAA